MLVNCVAYQNGEKLADIQPQEIHNYIAKPDCFVWVALFEPDNDTLALMQAEFDLHPLAVEDASHGHQRPKIEEYGTSLFAVLHMIEPIEGELRNGEVAIFVGRNYILTVRTRAQKGFAEVRARCENEPELLKRGPGYVLYAVMDAVVDRYFPLLHELETELETIEEQIFGNVSPRANIEALYAMKQRLMVFRHAVSPLLEALGNITGPPHLRRHAGILSRYLRPPDAAQSDHRIGARHHCHRDLGQRLHDQSARKRDHEAARRLRGIDRRANTGRRHLRHEFRLHAGAALALWIRALARSDGGR